MTSDNMSDDELNELLRDASARYRVAPEAPLERMWGRIETRVFDADVVPIHSRRRWLRALPYAAVLAAGLGLGFLAARAGTSPSVEAAADPSPYRPDVRNVAYDGEPLVGMASDYLSQTTGLLILLVGDLRAADGVPSATVLRARDLLSTTRLLLDNAPADPALQELLEDLELVLAQVVRLPSSPHAPEAALIRETLADREVLPRLTTMLADSRIAP